MGVSDRPNWYSETGPERRARRHHRFHAARAWISVLGILALVLAYFGGPFVHGQRCTTGTHLDSATGIATVQTECHQVHSWRP